MIHMRVILDTNILIYREQNDVLNTALAEIFKILSENKIEILRHPISDTEIQKHNDIDQKIVNKSKIAAYPSLNNYPDPYLTNDIKYLNIVDKDRKANTNDKNDNIILYSIYRNAASMLITNDQRLIKKAYRFDQPINVYSIDEALEYVREIFPSSKELQTPIGIDHTNMFNINLDDPLFDSLKADYGNEFEEWFLKKARDGRDCYVTYKSESRELGSFMACKEETELIDSKPFSLPAKKRLKITTLKVSSKGLRIGEALINIAIKEAMAKGCDEIYLTHFTEPVDDGLVRLIEKYGFWHSGYNDTKYLGKKEDIYVKNIRPKIDHNCLNPYEDDIKYFPSFYDGDKVNKFIIPIQQQYHDRLFLNADRQSTLFEHTGSHLVEGYAILKAYLTHSRIKKIQPGDILIFYKSGISCLTVIGVVDKIIYSLNNTDDIMNSIKNRTVYTYNEVEDMRKPLTAILFRHNYNVINQIHLDELIADGIINGTPQSISQISDEGYQKLISKGVIDESITFN